jgi:hypothetical protein
VNARPSNADRLLNDLPVAGPPPAQWPPACVTPPAQWANAKAIAPEFGMLKPGQLFDFLVLLPRLERGTY